MTNKVINENRVEIAKASAKRYAKREEIRDIENRLARAKSELSDIENEIAWLGGKCPSCGYLGQVYLEESDGDYTCQNCA